MQKVHIFYSILTWWTRQGCQNPIQICYMKTYPLSTSRLKNVIKSKNPYFLHKRFYSFYFIPDKKKSPLSLFPNIKGSTSLSLVQYFRDTRAAAKQRNNETRYFISYSRKMLGISISEKKSHKFFFLAC